MKRALSLCLLLIPLAFVSADLKIDGATKAKVYEFVKLDAAPVDAAASYIWEVYALKKVVDKSGNTFSLPVKINPKSAWIKDGKLIFVGPPGDYLVKLTSFKYDEKLKKPSLEQVETTVTIEGEAPPAPPTPPDPPTPPTPTDIPFPGDGFRVLIIEEKMDRTKLPASQILILGSATVRDYFRTHCANNGTECAIWDKDVDTANEPKIWQDAMKRKRTVLPWIIVSNGKQAFEGPLPLTVDETMILLKKYGGE